MPVREPIASVVEARSKASFEGSRWSSAAARAPVLGARRDGHEAAAQPASPRHRPLPSPSRPPTPFSRSQCPTDALAQATRLAADPLAPPQTQLRFATAAAAAVRPRPRPPSLVNPTNLHLALHPDHAPPLPPLPKPGRLRRTEPHRMLRPAQEHARRPRARAAVSNGRWRCWRASLRLRSVRPEVAFVSGRRPDPRASTPTGSTPVVLRAYEPTQGVGFEVSLRRALRSVQLAGRGG